MEDPTNRVEPTSLLDILAPENLTDFRRAATGAGLPRLSYWVMLRAWHSGKLEALKIGGRIMTTSAAVRRWIERSNEMTEKPARRPSRRSRPVTSEAAKRFLASRGLPYGAKR